MGLIGICASDGKRAGKEKPGKGREGERKGGRKRGREGRKEGEEGREGGRKEGIQWNSQMEESGGTGRGPPRETFLQITCPSPCRDSKVRTSIFNWKKTGNQCSLYHNGVTQRHGVIKGHSNLHRCCILDHIYMVFRGGPINCVSQHHSIKFY